MIVLKGQPTGHPVRRTTRRRPLIFALVGQLAARLGSLRRPGGSWSPVAAAHKGARHHRPRW